MANKTLTIKEIAREANVSVATVSQIINNNGRFSAATAAKVRKIMKDKGYITNRAARTLRTQKSQLIGIMMPDITNEFFARISLVIQNRFLEQNYTTIICNTNEMENMEKRHIENFTSMQVDGLVFLSGGNCEQAGMLDVPSVFIDRKPLRVNDKSMFFIESDNENGGYIATKFLFAKGCRRVAFLRLNKAVSSYDDRYRGYLRALRERGSENEELVILAERADADNGYKVMKEFLEHDFADGIFCSMDLLAVGCIRALIEKGVSVPNDVQVVGFDDIPSSRTSIIPITTVHQQMTRFGELAADILLARISGIQVDAHRYTLPTQLIERNTTR